MQKIINVISLISFLLVVSILGGGTYSYLWLKNEDNQKMIKEKLMKEVTSSISLPSISGPALPTGALSPAQKKNEKKKALGVPFSL